MDGMQKHLLKFMGAISLLAIAACSEKEAPYVEKPATELYYTGYDELLSSDYKDAAAAFDEVERQHPYSEWATRGQLMSAYANYLNGDYDKAIATLDAFLQLHPGYQHIDYAYYLRALCFYDRILSVLRDQKNTYEALSALQAVVKKFPESKYGRDAQLKMDLVYDHLAGKEMSVGRYYMQKELYLSAINRFQTVVDAYQRTTHVPEALHRLVECYLAVGLTREAQVIAAVLGHNFPGSDWYADCYFLLEGEDLRPEWVKLEDGSWVERLTNFQLF
jgi:outer membrane protein assembly factor BamD